MLESCTIARKSARVLLAAAFVWCAKYAHADEGAIVVTQSSDSHIIAHVSTDMDSACLNHPTNLTSYLPNQFFLLTTNVSCATTPIARYAAVVDLGVVPDGDYQVQWVFDTGGFGLCCGSFTRSFSVQNGLLVDVGVPLPSLSDLAHVMLAVLVGFVGCAAVSRRGPRTGFLA
jgi:hypothetical protein